MKALLGLLRKEIYHILRDRRTLVVIVLLPVLQVVLFGFAIRTDVNDVTVAFVDPSPDFVTVGLRDRFAATETFRTVAVLATVKDLEARLQSGEAQLGIVFEPAFAQKLARDGRAQVQVISDAIEPNTAGARQAYAMAVIQGYEAELNSKFPLAVSRMTRGVRIVAEGRLRFNPTRESSNLFVPGLMAVVLTVISALMTALSLTREKETGSMESLLVSPLRPVQIIVGKVTPYLGIGLMSVVLMLVEARLVFHVPLLGSPLLLVGESLLFILVSLALGILISARTSSQRVAMLIALVGTMLPNQLLSGFVFPIESLPTALQMLSNIVPARWFVLIARGIMLKGIGLTYLWRETLILAGMALFLIVVSARSFKVRLA
jgi:ABC-2 type transport system permease protein